MLCDNCVTVIVMILFQTLELEVLSYSEICAFALNLCWNKGDFLFCLLQHRKPRPWRQPPQTNGWFIIFSLFHIYALSRGSFRQKLPGLSAGWRILVALLRLLWRWNKGQKFKWITDGPLFLMGWAAEGQFIVHIEASANTSMVISLSFLWLNHLDCGDGM